MLYECSSTGVAETFLRVIAYCQVCQASDLPKPEENFTTIVKGCDDVHVPVNVALPELC